MGHTKPEALQDLELELKELRSWAGMKEKKPGIFYCKSVSFLHFHDQNGERWADVKVAGNWQRIEINFEAKAKLRKAFVQTVSDAYFAFLKG